jgi:lysophospholipase L1-like esterase
MKRLSIALALICCAQAQEHWVATWATAQQAVRVAPQIIVGGRALPTPVGIGLQAAPGANFKNQTVRMIAHASIGGSRVRIELFNAVGGQAVNMGAAHIALRAKGSEIVAGSDRALTFHGQPGCTLRPGVSTVSDPVDLNIPKLADLAVSLYFPGETGPPTSHALGLHTAYISEVGDFTEQASIANAATVASYYYLASIDVLAPAKSAAIVALGDSITDGSHSTVDADRAWPTVLAARLQANKATASFAVVNEGIGGNQVLKDGAGVSALARFDRDALGVPGVEWVMILESINDIGSMARADGTLTAADLIGALDQMVERAHMHGIKVAGCTLTPYHGASYYSDAGEAIREAVNDWIRKGGAFDAVVDFEAAVRDPANPKEFRADLQTGDHLHPSDAGYAAMANAVDLGIFAGKKK